MSTPSPSTPTVVITGASSGIGHATSLAFAHDGANIVLAARDQLSLDVVASECERVGVQTLVVPTDVTDPEAVQKLADAALERFGRIDVWINNVGTGAVGRFENVPVAAHRRVIEANLLGHMYGAHAVLPHFRSRGRGILINMISVGGWTAVPYAASYVASKFALRGLSESLRAEVSDLPGIHVCEVYPTFVDSPGMSHGANYTGKRIGAAAPMLDPREVAMRLVTLARDPKPSVSMGSAAWPARLAHTLAPDLTARMARKMIDRALDKADASPVTDGNLFAASEGHAIDGGFRQRQMSSTPMPVALAVGAAVLALWWMSRPQPPRA